MTHGETSRRVRDALDHDPAALEMLSRGVVNVRALARWMIDLHGWSGSEDAVVSALRRVGDREAKVGRLDAARQALTHAHLNTRSRMCSVALSNASAVQRRLPQILQMVDFARGEKVRLVSSEQGFKVITDSSNLAKLERLVGDAAIIETKPNLTEIDLIMPAKFRETAGILALVAMSLAVHGISVAEIVDGIDQHMLFVAAEDEERAYRVLSALIRNRT